MQKGGRHIRATSTAGTGVSLALAWLWAWPPPHASDPEAVHIIGKIEAPHYIGQLLGGGTSPLTRRLLPLHLLNLGCLAGQGITDALSP